MLRKISEKLQKRVRELWLEGYTYRGVSSKLGISLGAISHIIGSVRKRAPALDELRRLNLEIRRQGSNVHDALRGSRLLDKVNQMGINLSELEDLLKILTEMASERNVGEEKLLNTSLKLMRLEAQSAKTCREIVEDFETKQKLTKHLELRVKKLREEAQKLNAEKRNLEGALGRVREELKRTVRTKKQLDRLSLSELAKLVEHAEREGSLDNRIVERQNELESLKRRIAFLRKNASDIERIDMLLWIRSLNFKCPYCGWLTWKTLSRWECENLLLRNAPFTARCSYCGATTHYDLIKMLLAISLNILS